MNSCNTKQIYFETNFMHICFLVLHEWAWSPTTTSHVRNRIQETLKYAWADASISKKCTHPKTVMKKMNLLYYHSGKVIVSDVVIPWDSIKKGGVFFFLKVGIFLVKINIFQRFKYKNNHGCCQHSSFGIWNVKNGGNHTFYKTKVTLPHFLTE